MSEQNKDVIRRLVEGVWVRRDMSVFDATFADDFVETITISGFTIDRIANGRIAERWHMMDMAGMMLQLNG